MCCFGYGTPTQGSSANDLRDGQRIVGNKNNRKRKERMWPTLNGSVHNFIGRAESIVPEINKVYKRNYWSKCFYAGGEYLTLFFLRLHDELGA